MYRHDSPQPSSHPSADPLSTPAVIRRQLNRSGNILISAIEPLDDDDFYRPCAGGASVAWTLGHLACVHDLFGTWLGAPGRALPPEMHDVFNRLDLGESFDDNDDAGDQACKAERIDRTFFSRPRLMGAFRQAQVRNLELLQDFDPARWTDPSPPTAPDSLPTLGAIWESLAVHTFWHLGELSGSHPRFRNTYTLNTVLHYFYVPPPSTHIHEERP